MAGERRSSGSEVLLGGVLRTVTYVCEGTGIHMCTKSGTTICTVCILSCEIKNDFMHNVPWYSISVFYLLLNFLYFITFGRR